MNVFISWSGTRSKALADTLRDWLPNVIQAIQPWMSEADIDKGTRWSIDLANQLKDTKVGIICLTPENLDSPWIHFEAGALSKTIDKTYVCPYLFQVEPTDLTGPLVQFQTTKANKEDTLKLMHTINKALGERTLSETQLKKAFDIWWHAFDENLKKIRDTSTKSKPHRSERDVLEETLQLVRDINKRFEIQDRKEKSIWVVEKGTINVQGADERLHGDILEHRHEGYDYWHPASRIHPKR